MKTNFKKSMAVLLVVFMLASVFSVTAFAAYTAKIQAGSAEGSTLKAELEDGTPITEDMLSLVTNSSNKVTLPSEAYYERADYIQDGWTKTASGGGTLLKFGSTQTVRNNSTKFYPHWKQLVFTFTFGAGSNYDANDPANYTDASMTQLKEVIVKTDGSDAQQVTLPGAMFTRDGYVQTGWSVSKTNNGTGTKYDLNSVYTKAITGDVNLYPYWTPVVYNVEFVGGADGVGTAQTVEVAHNKTTKAPDAIFTRLGYTQIGWATTENSAVVELDLNSNTPAILDNVTYYPVWEKNVYSTSISEGTINFGSSCVGYTSLEAQDVTITNNSNVNIDIVLPTSAYFDVAVKSGSLSVAADGGSVTFSVTPKNDLAIGKYAEELVFSCGIKEAELKLSVNFKVVEHSFGVYKSNNDATYSADGTKTAECLNDCGTYNTIVDEGTMKTYSADNNDAVGIASSYIHHRTVRFTAYGSGMDDAEGVVGKRFVPVAWYVNDEFNGEFENGYEVVFTHTLFGDYTLTINYVEEEYNAETGEWVTTGVTDEKTFEYTVGTTAEEEQEIIRPNTILSLIFGLFQELLKLLGLG